MSPRKPTSPGPATAVAESTVPVVVAVVAEAKDPNRLCPKCNRPLSEDPPADPDHDSHDLCYLEKQQAMNAELLKQVPKLRVMVAERLTKAVERFSACFKSANRATWPPEVARALAEAEEELKLGDIDAQRAREEGAPGAFAPAKHHYFRAGDAITKAFYFKEKRVAEEVLAQLTPDVAQGPNAKFRTAVASFRAACTEANGWKKSAAIREAERLMIEAMEAAIAARKQLREGMRKAETIAGAVDVETVARLDAVAAVNDNLADRSDKPGAHCSRARKSDKGDKTDGHQPKHRPTPRRTRLSEGEGDEE